MLIELRGLDDEQAARLMEIYEESNRENIEYFFPEYKGTEEGLMKVIQSFTGYIKNEFLSQPGNVYYVWVSGGEWVSALRLYKLEGFHYIEALETKPSERKRGYACALLQAVAERVGSIIRDNVSKSNTASLAVHKKCGFEIESQDAVDFLNGNEIDSSCYGMIFKNN